MHLSPEQLQNAGIATGRLEQRSLGVSLPVQGVAGFQVVWVSVFYIFAMLCLALHLWHGTWSMLQTLGLSHPKYNGLRQTIAWALTILVVVANISFPVAVLTGVVKDAPHVSASLPAAR